MISLAKKPKLRKKIAQAIVTLEFTLATLVVLGTVWYLFLSISTLLAASGEISFFFIFIEILLSAIIGIEIARLLITHSLIGLLEIFGLVLARKVLLPESTPVDILIVIVAFGILVYVRSELCKQGNVTDGLDD